MSEDQEPLQYLPLERWFELQNIFKSDWPRGISGYAALELQKQRARQGIEYTLKVYCPFGDVENGMVAINDKKYSYEVLIQCPKNETDQLCDALKQTKVIDWNRKVIVLSATQNVINCLQNTNMDLDVHRFLHTFILEHEFEDVSLPPNITFGLVTLEYLELINSTWPNRYPNSAWHFEQLIKAKCGFGLFYETDLISWVFIKEVGPLQHLYTVEAHRVSTEVSK